MIEKLAFYRDRGRVRCRYFYKEESYTAEYVIFDTKRTCDWREGTELTLLVAPKKPQDALIRALYVKAERK